MLKTFDLPKQSEFRFEVETDKQGTIKVIQGSAEIFGVELAINVEYKFTGRKLAVYTWHGCQIETTGSFSVEYVGKETPMNTYLNLFYALVQLYKKKDQPRVLIVGPADMGKSSLCKILVNYIAKLSITNQCPPPILVDLDPSQGSLSLPGSVSSMVVARPFDAEDEFSASLIVMKTSPLVFYYGSQNPLDKPRLYKSLISNLARATNERLALETPKTFGLIIDSNSQLTDPGGSELLHAAVTEFKVNVILAIGQERMVSSLQQTYGDSSDITILRLAMSGGVVPRDKQVRKNLQLLRVKEYFYGSIRNTLTPFSQVVSFSEIVVRRIEEGSLVPSSALPIGQERKIPETKFVKVETGDILLHSVLAITHLSLPGTHKDGETRIYTPEEESRLLLQSNILGFVYISEVDDVKRKMVILSPTPGKLPPNFMLMGSLKWMDA